MKVAIYTLTRDRLLYTQHSFESLEARAQYPYDHYVIDNGSTDGTVEWLRANTHKFAGVLYNEKNYGNCVGNNQAVEFIGPGNYDLIIRMDNDCEVVTPGLLRTAVEIYTHLRKYGQMDTMTLSPRVTGIVNQPPRGGTMKVQGRTLSFVGVVGGLFRIVPANALKKYHWPVAMSIVAGEESCFASWFIQNGGFCCYAEDLVVYHYETTDGQVRRFPEYERRKREEWNNHPETDFQMPKSKVTV